MTPENKDRLKTAVRAISNAFDNDHDADCALINAAIEGGDTDYVVAKMLGAISTALSS
jgi:ADP-ribosylglycohydrolase